MGLAWVIGFIVILIVGYFIYVSFRMKENYEEGDKRKPGEKD